MTKKKTQQDFSYYENWLEKSIEAAKKVSIAAKKNNSLSIFTISTTAKITIDAKPYLTPNRKIVHGFIAGSVVFTQSQAILLSKHIDGIIDLVLIDAEKKIAATVGSEKEFYEYFKLAQPNKPSKTIDYVEMGNLSAACSNFISKSQFHEYKPNDLTIEAVWYFLSEHHKILSGKKITIIGSGNIGFKLALKLVESGCSVEIVRRDVSKGLLMADAIDIIKPKSTIATAHFNPDPLQASLFSDAIIGCTLGNPAISWDMIRSMKENGMIIDVGKGTIFKNAVEKAIKKNVPIFRADISCAIDGCIATIQRNKEIISSEIGRSKFKEKIFLVSGGQLGKNGDIIVDNHNKPSQIFGVANGMGDKKESISKIEMNNLNIVKEAINK